MEKKLYLLIGTLLFSCSSDEQQAVPVGTATSAAFQIAAVTTGII